MSHYVIRYGNERFSQVNCQFSQVNEQMNVELQWLQNHQGLELHILHISGEICPKFLADQVAVALVLVHTLCSREMCSMAQSGALLSIWQ